jgi:hypothetical protein
MDCPTIRGKGLNRSPRARLLRKPGSARRESNTDAGSGGGLDRPGNLGDLSAAKSPQPSVRFTVSSLTIRPEIAALSMSGSSVLVAVNALVIDRLRLPTG